MYKNYIIWLKNRHVEQTYKEGDTQSKSVKWKKD